VSLPNGKRRRKGPPLRDMPPDPRPLQVRAQAFYKRTQVPSQEEIDVSILEFVSTSEYFLAKLYPLELKT